MHTVLDLAGFIPGLGAIPDLINAGLCAVEGDMRNAARSGVAAVPLFGNAILRQGDEAIDAARRGTDDAGGTNAFDNLVLIRNDPYHLGITKAQQQLVRGLQPGQSARVNWPVVPGVVYPPQRGACDDRGHHDR